MDKYNIKFYNSVKKFLNIPMRLFFNIKVSGIDNIPESNYILAGNHKSIFDMPLLITQINDNIHFMAKKEVFDIKVLNNIIERMGAFAVDRENVDIKAIKTALKLLKEEAVLGIFPEGTRNKSNELILPFKDGVSMISSKSKKLIVPFGISGEYKFRGKVYLNIGKPIDINSIDKDKRNKYLEESVKELILKKY